MTYASVILPVPFADHYTYILPPELAVKAVPGMRVIVPLGRKKWHTGIVHSLSKEHQAEYTLREACQLVDQQPLVSEVMLRFWQWLADYYLCSLGDVYRAAVPASLRPDADSPLEVSSLLAPRTDTFVRLTPGFRSKPAGEILEASGKAPKQKALLQSFMNLSGRMPEGQPGLLKRDLMRTAGVSPSVFSGLADKGILEAFESTYRIRTIADTGSDTPKLLSGIQEEALIKIRDHYQSKNVVLLHGVAASGKTELYIHLISEQMKQGKQCLYLLPEIALTTQIVKRLKRVFGDRLGVYHSRYSEHQRSEVYRDLLPGDRSLQLVIGARSAVFLPFRNLGLIIIDEEQDSSFKQEDPAPRYHARDAAIMLAAFTEAKVLLGTATPAFESYYNARAGKFGLVQLPQRYLQYAKPEIHIADLAESYRKKSMRSHFTPLLYEQMETMQAAGRQVILFQNRRGYAPWIQCASCAWIPKCGSCDVSLSFHKTGNRLICHYCGHSETVPGSCRSCESKELKARGFGTEKIEDEIRELFPGTAVRRMDLDATGSRRKYEALIRAFEAGKTDVLVGTQIITKGLDFGGVGLVGIMNADNLLYFPDFRAFERAYQLLLQVAGRAGRREEAGRVVIQTSDPAHPVINHLLKGDYHRFYLSQMRERREFRYPPYYRLVKLMLRHRDRSILESGSATLAAELREYSGWEVLGPQFPPVSRLHKRYIMTLLLKIDKKGAFDKQREILRNIIRSSEYRKLQLIVDVDPW